MMPYDSYMQIGVGLDTRNAFQSGVELDRKLTGLFSNTSIKIKTDELSQANKKVLELQSNLKAAMNPTRGTIDLGMLSQQLDRSNASLAQYAQTLSSYGKDGEQAFLSLTKSIASAEAPTSRLSQGLKNAGEQLKRTVGWQLSSSAIHGVMSTYSQAIGYAKELNRSLTDIRIVTGQSNAQMAQFAKTANIAAKNLSSTTTRYTDAALIYYQQGLSDKAVKERADVTIKMANVAGISAEKASQQLTSIWNNFYDGSKSLEHYADVMVKLGAETASSSDEISKGIQKFAAIGNTVGLSYEYAASALATVTATTRESADTVGTSFRTLFSRLQGLSLGETLEDGTTLNKYSKALNTVGIRIKETNGDMKSMNTILDELGAKWNTLGKDTQIGLAQSIGGARQYSTFMALMDNWDYFQENVNRANSASGALQKQQDIYAESWAAASKQVQASMEGIFDSVINDKFVIGATKGFATVLDSVKGLTQGLGGLDGMLVSVGNIALGKYAKELPGMLEDIRYNANYIFNPKTGAIDKKQKSIFGQAYEGLANMANQNGMQANLTYDDNGKVTGFDLGDLNGYDPEQAAEIRNAKLALDRRAEYLSVEKTLSEREKQEYLQAMDTAALWDQRVGASAAKVQNSKQMLEDMRSDIGQEQYQQLLDFGQEYKRQVVLTDDKGNKIYNESFNLADSSQRQKYYEEQITALELEREQKTKSLTSQSQIDNINKIYNNQIKDLQKEQLKFTDDFFKGIPALQLGLKDDSGYTKSILESMGAGLSEKFSSIVEKITSGAKITLSEKETFQKGIEAFQKPLIKASEDFGTLSHQTNKLKDSFNKNSNAAFKASEASKNLGDVSKQVGRSWFDLQKTVKQIGGVQVLDKKTGHVKATDEFKEASAAYKKLQKALSGETKGLSESDVYKLISNFETKANALTDTVEREAWKKGLTDEQTAEIRQRASENKRTLEQQQDIEWQQKKAGELNIEHKKEKYEQGVEAVQLAASIYSAYAGAEGAWDTMLDKNAKGSEKIGALLGSGVQMGMLYSSLSKSTVLANGAATVGSWAGGLLSNAGAASGIGALSAAGSAVTSSAGGMAAAAAAGGGPPGWLIAAIMATVAIAPKLVDIVDDTIETTKERTERWNEEYITLQQLAQSAKEKQTMFEQANSAYLSSVEKFETTELGSLENVKALSEANAQAMSIIEDNNLTYEDYGITDSGLIKINNNALDQAEEKLITQTAEAQAKYSISNATQLLRSRGGSIAEQYKGYGNQAEDTLKSFQKKIDEGETLGKSEAKAYKDLFYLSQQKEAKDAQILTAFNQGLISTAQIDGSFTKQDKAAIATLTSSMSVDVLKNIQKDLDKKFDTKNALWQSETSIKNNALKNNVMTQEQLDMVLNSEEYKTLRDQDIQKADQFLLDAVKNQAYLNEYEKLIDNTKKEQKELNPEYNREALENKSMAEIKDLVDKNGDRNLYTEGLTKEYKYVLAQYNKTANDFYKAVGEYLPDVNFNGALEQFTLYEAEVLAETLQDFGDTFGNDAAKSIYNATINASEKDREVLLTNLKTVDFSGSAVQSLSDIYELSEDFGGLYTELFDDIKKSFGGDAGLAKSLTNDKTIQKLISSFEKFGDIDAAAIMQATHSSADLKETLELANFNTGGLAAALEGIASGQIEKNQLSNSLLAGLSVLNQIDSARGAAFDSVDTYDKGRSVTDLTKFAGNLGKTIEYNLKNGLMFDEPMMNAWGEMFGENKRYELKQDFISWGSVDKKDIAKNFNNKYKAEKELLDAMQKNPYDFNALWKYAFDTSQVEENEKENDEWIKSGEDKEDTENRSYNSISEHEWETYLKLTKLDENGNRVARSDLNNYDKDFVDQVKVKVDKENHYKDNYVNIDGAIYKVGEGERDVQWNGEKWVHKDAEGNEIALNNNNALFGYDYAQKGMVFTDYFEQQNMNYEDLQNIMQLNLGLSKNTTDRMIAEAAAQNTSVQKIYGDGQVSGAVNAMVGAANENNEYITADQMELIFNSSEDLKAKYQGVGFTGWIRDYLSGADLSKEDVLAGKLGERQALKERYIDFRGAKSNSYEDMDEALVANTGISTSDRLKGLGKQMTISKVSGTKTEWQTTKGAFGKTVTKEVEVPNVTKEEVTGFDMSDAMDQLLAMGYTQEAAYEALNDTVKENGGVLVESIRGVDGSIQVFSSESQAYQDWATQHGIDTAEADSEAFGRFISEQDAVARAVQQMAIEAQAKAEYERTHNADGTLKTPEQIAEEGGAAEGDVATDEKGNPIVDQDGDGKPDTTVTGPDVKPQEAVAGDPGDTTGTGGGGDNSKYGGLTKEQYDIVMNNDQVKYENGKFVMVNAYNPATDPYGDEGTWRQQNQATIDAVNAANKAAEAAAEVAQKQAALQGKAVGQNQHKITKHYASGRNNDDYEGLAQVGELGPELSIDKDGNATMLGVNGPTYAYVKKDDIIFTAEQTEDILRTTPDLNNVPGFSESKGMSGATTGVSSMYIKDNIWDGYGGTSSGGSGEGGDGDDDWEPDRYVVIMEQLQDLQREYARLVKAKERAYGADKIKALDAEIAKTNELISAQKEYINEIEQFLQKDIQKLKDEGVYDSLIFDRNGVIRNFDEISEKYKKAAEEGDETAAKQYEAIMKYMETNNLLEQQLDSLIDMQWQLMDARIERITTKVDIKIAVDDTDLQYLSYQLNKINDEAYDVAKALSLVGESMEVNLNKINAYRQGLSETLTEAFTEIGLEEDKQQALLEKIESGALTQEDLDNFEISPDHSANIMNVLLDYRQQLITVNEQLDQLRDQVTSLVVRHFTDFTKDVGEQTSLINTYTNTLQAYADLTELLNGRFQGNMDKILSDINTSISKNAKDSIKNTELLVQSAELKYKELNEMYKAASELGDQATMDKVADARDTAYKELQEANNKYASAWLSANQAFLNEFKFGVNKAIEDFQEQLSPLFGTIEQLSSAFERQNSLNDQYIDDYEKYYELNKLNRELQTAIDETDNINNKKALAKLQAEINKEKASENKLSEYDLEVLKNKVELEKARLALDEAKNAKSTVTLSRDQNGNWGYIYTAEEDKVAKAEQEYEDKLYEYQKANKEYLDDLQAMVIEAQTNMVEAISALDVNDPHYEEQRKSIIDSYMQTVAYVKEQMMSALSNQEDSRLVALERYDISMINLKNDFEDLSLSFITGEKNLENYFNTLETSMPQLLAQLNELEDKYEANIADINNYVTGNKNIVDYMNENMDTLVTKSEEANQKIQNLYDTMVDDLVDVNAEVADIYNNWLPHIMDMTEKNEILAESISKIQHELSDLSEVEVPPVLTGEAWEHPEGYTENDYGVIRKLTEDEIKLREEIKKDIKTDENGKITNYDELKEKWYEEAPAEGEEDKRDADKKAKWELLQKLIGYGTYIDPTAKQTIGLTEVWETIQSNAAAMYNAAVAVAEGFSGATLTVEQTVTIAAEFPNVTNSSEIEDAFNSLINDAAQYANRK